MHICIPFSNPFASGEGETLSFNQAVVSTASEWNYREVAYLKRNDEKSFCSLDNLG